MPRISQNSENFEDIDFIFKNKVHIVSFSVTIFNLTSILSNHQVFGSLHNLVFLIVGPFFTLLNSCNNTPRKKKKLQE